MKNKYFLVGILLGALLLRIYFFVFNKQNFSFPVNLVYCLLYSFLGGYLVVYLKVKNDFKLKKGFDWIGIFFPLIGIIIAALSGWILQMLL